MCFITSSEQALLVLNTSWHLFPRDESVPLSYLEQVLSALFEVLSEHRCVEGLCLVL